jgi:hypothetical protein
MSGKVKRAMNMIVRAVIVVGAGLFTVWRISPRADA